jgi:hypothetical protein
MAYRFEKHETMQCTKTGAAPLESTKAFSLTRHFMAITPKLI